MRDVVTVRTTMLFLHRAVIAIYSCLTSGIAFVSAWKNHFHVKWKPGWEFRINRGEIWHWDHALGHMNWFRITSREVVVVPLILHSLLKLVRTCYFSYQSAYFTGHGRMCEIMYKNNLTEELGNKAVFLVQQIKFDIPGATDHRLAGVLLAPEVQLIGS